MSFNSFLQSFFCLHSILRNSAIAAVTAAILTHLSVAALFAEGRLWIEALSASGGGTVLSTPGSSQLRLACDTSATGDCTWSLVVYYQNYDPIAFGASLDLGLTGSPELTKYRIQNFSNSTNDFIAFHAQTTTNLPDGLLIENAGGGNLQGEGLPLQRYPVATFDLVRNPSQPVSTSLVSAGVGGVEFGGNDGDPCNAGNNFYELVSIGPNVPLFGVNVAPWPGNALPHPVIVISEDGSTLPDDPSSQSSNSSQSSINLCWWSSSRISSSSSMSQSSSISSGQSSSQSTVSSESSSSSSSVGATGDSPTVSPTCIIKPTRQCNDSCKLSLILKSAQEDQNLSSNKFIIETKGKRGDWRRVKVTTLKKPNKSIRFQGRFNNQYRAVFGDGSSVSCKKKSNK